MEKHIKNILDEHKKVRDDMIDYAYTWAVEFNSKEDFMRCINKVIDQTVELALKAERFYNRYNNEL